MSEYSAMSTLTSEQAFRTAVKYHEGGRLAEAENLYRQILAQDPNHAPTLYLLGMIAGQKGQAKAGLELTRRAIQINPGFADAHHSLGCLLQQTGQSGEAIGAFEAALRLKPDYALAHHNLGVALQASGRVAEAIGSFRNAVRASPDYARAHYNLGRALEASGQLHESAGSLQQVVRINPNDADAHYSLGWISQQTLRLDEAIAAYRRALVLRPTFASALGNLAIALHQRAQSAGAKESDFRDGMAAFRRMAELLPTSAAVWSNLGSALMKIGEQDEAISAFRKSLQLDPNVPAAHSALIYAAHFHPGFDAAMLLAEARRYADFVEKPLMGSIAPHMNDRAADRRLKVGYVSPDLRNHPIARFLLPLLEHHDSASVEVFCYSATARPDETTERFRRLAGTFVDVARMSDAQLAERVRADQIDVLVDLSLHMPGTRLAAFARKPAPVQATWLGYAGTTGLSAVDYRVSDRYLDPPGECDDCYSEKTIRLAGSYWCYEPYVRDIEVNPLPAGERGFVTFACFNGFLKVTGEALDLWGRLLSTIPNSRLLIHTPLDDHHQRILERFAKNGVEANRIGLVGNRPVRDYLLGYHQTDIALDPFPYGGGTTTCDALWMGVPTVTLRGRTAVGRGGASILSSVGLSDWIAGDAEEYLSIAVKMAGDVARLSELRRNLRQALEQSALMDGRKFAREMEAAYRQMWIEWASK